MDPADADRFDALYLTHARAVRAYALRRTGPDEADDVVADTFAAAWRGLDRIPDEPLPWLLGIARNVLMHQRRSAGRRAALADRLRREPAPAAAPPAGTPPVLLALAALSERDREVVMLVCWEGLDAAAAGRVLGISAAAARVRLHRARRRLRRLLDDPTVGVAAQEAP